MYLFFMILIHNNIKVDIIRHFETKIEKENLNCLIKHKPPVTVKVKLKLKIN